MVKVSKFYDKKPVLKDIYLSFFYGAKIGVLGLNGSGKSSACCGSSPAPTRILTARSFFRKGYSRRLSRTGAEAGRIENGSADR